MDYYFINSTTCPRFPQMVNPGRNSFARNNSDFHGFCSASMQDLCLLQISPLDPLTPWWPCGSTTSTIHLTSTGHRQCLMPPVGTGFVGGSLWPGSSAVHRKVTRLALPSILCHPLSSEPWNSTVFIAVSGSISLFVACAIENCHQGSELILGWEKRQETDTFPSPSPGNFTLQPSPSSFNYSRVHLQLGSGSACLPSNHQTYPDMPESSLWIQNKFFAF